MEIADPKHPAGANPAHLSPWRIETVTMPAIGSTVAWNEHDRRPVNGPAAGPLHQIGDTDRVASYLFTGIFGDWLLVRLTANHGPVLSTGIGTEGMWNGYWRQEGEVIGYEPVETRPPAASDQLGRHLEKLASGD
jgi:hypothetical protein